MSNPVSPKCDVSLRKSCRKIRSHENHTKPTRQSDISINDSITDKEEGVDQKYAIVPKSDPKKKMPQQK